MNENKIKFITIEPVDEIIEPMQPKPIIHNKNSRRFKNKKIPHRNDIEKKLVWTLQKYIGERVIEFDFFHFMPSEKLSDQITSKNLIALLNAENLFDFEYIPEEGDNLFIQYEIRGGEYLSFLYNSGKWEIGLYDANHITKYYRSGVIQ